ncbi:differentially expressed in FDCP 8 homolog [Oppia nitens]|uniref:differentially expressed in FDCP 8 homolog n=1 Tax=Oppia nitens TaxID=1686743 RepID=UPI0023DA3D75|nr:differentially expressed in FDCP 8 homolog [Oppia nitens]
MSSTEDSKLSLTEDHFSQDKYQLDADTDELMSTTSQMESAIDKHIKILRRVTDDDIKKKLVIKICELRIKLNQLNDINEQLYVCGHKLVQRNDNKIGSQLICDQCLKRTKNKIFGLKKNDNMTLICQFCQFVVHRYCQTNIMRKCPKMMFEESALNVNQNEISRNVILKICPEIGLSNQDFRCAECKATITPTNSRICDYNGLYYCNCCHFGQLDATLIPARIIHNWDFTPKPVSRSSLQFINYIKLKPVLFNITELNSMLYGLVDELTQIKRVRSELTHMFKYIRICRQPTKPKISLNNYLLDENCLNCYSLSDLCHLDKLLLSVSDAHKLFMDHIINHCEGCRGKGYFCELCRDSDDLLFAFSSNVANCKICSAVYHKNCYYRQNKVCRRCQRLANKQMTNDSTINESIID